MEIKLHLPWMMLTKETRITSPLDGATISNKAAECLKILLKCIAVVPYEKEALWKIPSPVKELTSNNPKLHLTLLAVKGSLHVNILIASL